MFRAAIFVPGLLAHHSWSRGSNWFHGEILEHFEGGLAPEVLDGGLLEFLEPLEDEAGHDSKVTASLERGSITYFLPVLSPSGLICVRLRYEK